MTILNHAVLSFLFISLLGFNTSVLSDEAIQVNHQLTSHADASDGTSVTLSLRIHNPGNTNYHSVKLIPTGDLFLVSEKNRSLNIGHLPPQGETIIQWTTNTPLAADYFMSDMPVFFHLVAKSDENGSIRLPLFSQGE